MQSIEIHNTHPADVSEQTSAALPTQLEAIIGADLQLAPESVHIVETECIPGNQSAYIVIQAGTTMLKIAERIDDLVPHTQERALLSLVEVPSEASEEPQAFVVLSGRGDIETDITEYVWNQAAVIRWSREGVEVFPTPDVSRSARLILPYGKTGVLTVLSGQNDMSLQSVGLDEFRLSQQ